MRPNASHHGEHVCIKFVGIILPIVVITFSITIAFFERANETKQNQKLKEKLNNLAATYSLLFSGPVATNNIEQIKSYSIALVLDEDFASVQVKSANGSTLHDYSSGASADESFKKTISINYSDEKGLNKVGTLNIALSKDRINNERLNRIKAELALLIALIAATLLSIGIAFKQSIHRPLTRLSYDANHDALTHLLNRRSFKNRVKRTINDRQFNHNRHKLMLLDLDGFKAINDKYGHHTGDKVLQDIAHILRDSVRNDDVVARLGGDEFAILLPECDKENSITIAEKIRRRINEYEANQIADSPVSASIGLVSMQPDINLEQHFKMADKACYQAKNAGKNQVQHLQTEKLEMA